MARAAGACAALALACRALYGAGFASYDPMWSLIWGRQLLHGQVPGYRALEVAPTPHPLGNVLGLIAALAGQSGPVVLAVAGFASLGLLGWAAFRLGRELFGWAVGVGFAAVLLTSAPLVDEGLQAVVDVPFLALVLLAMALEAARPREGTGPFVALALAGLLRPEAWPLALALLAWRAAGSDRRTEMRGAIALTVAAPAVWMATDLLVTGDPFWSLHATRALGGLLQVPTGTGHALTGVPRFLRFVLPDPVVWAGLVGLLAGLGLRYRQSLLPATVLALGLVAYVGLGVVGLPLVNRYAFVPAAMVALFASVAALGWSGLHRGRERTVWLAAGVPLGLAVVVLSAGPGGHDLREVVHRSNRTAADQRALRAAVQEAPARRLRRCPPVRVGDFLLVPLVAYRAGLDPADLTLSAAGGQGSAVSGAGRRWRVSVSCPSGGA